MHEVEVLNFLMSLTKKLLQPLLIKIKESIQQACQQFKCSELNILTSKELNLEYDRLNKLISLKNFSGMESETFEERIGHL